MFLKRILGAETKKRKRNIFMNYIDFHTHLDCYKNQEELKNQLESIDDEETIVSASMDASSYKKNLSLANDAKKLNLKAKIIPTLGIHPARAQAMQSIILSTARTRRAESSIWKIFSSRKNSGAKATEQSCSRLSAEKLSQTDLPRWNGARSTLTRTQSNITRI